MQHLQNVDVSLTIYRISSKLEKTDVPGEADCGRRMRRSPAEQDRTGGHMKLVPILSAAALGIVSSAALAQTKWDLPAAYPASNFHSENLMQFAADVEKATEGKLKITVHANASLFKAPEIKRAVQTNQAQIGEILLSNYSNENALYGVDVLPFLATSYEAARKLDRASRPTLEKLLAAQGMKLLYTVA